MNAPLLKHHLRGGKIVGEPMVWLSAMGLGIGPLMVGTLLGGILINGIEVFSATRIEIFTLAGDGKESVVAGELVKQQHKAGTAPGAQGVEEVQIFTGNKDLYGQGFRFIDLSAIPARSIPADAPRGGRLAHR